MICADAACDIDVGIVNPSLCGDAMVYILYVGGLGDEDDDDDDDGAIFFFSFSSPNLKVKNSV